MVVPTASGTKAELILHALFWPGLPEGNGCHPRASPSCGTLHFRSPDKAGAIVPAFVEGPRNGSEGDIIVYSERKMELLLHMITFAICVLWYGL